ncbi:hypothetical protein EDB87DRAFT_1689473 [Lactarius vividus]|nr:hypothetical protein EDB87DRAFT_1689473 [Lactarius vividus]
MSSGSMAHLSARNLGTFIYPFEAYRTMHSSGTPRALRPVRAGLVTVLRPQRFSFKFPLHVPHRLSSALAIHHRLLPFPPSTIPSTPIMMHEDPPDDELGFGLSSHTQVLGRRVHPSPPPPHHGAQDPSRVATHPLRSSSPYCYRYYLAAYKPVATASTLHHMGVRRTVTACETRHGAARNPIATSTKHSAQVPPRELATMATTEGDGMRWPQ